MCGIAGFFCWGERRPHPDMARGLFLAQQLRGTDAAGYAWLRPDGIYVQKAKGPARSLLGTTEEAEWAEVCSSPIALFHARATTKGSEAQNENNHPVNGLGWVVTHNGCVTNDDDLWGYYKDKRFAEVDTSAIPLVLSKGGADFYESLRHLTILGGNATIAAWGVQHPERVALVRLGYNDLYLFHDQQNRILYWSSAALAGRLMPGATIGGVRFLSMAKLGDDRALVLSPEGGESFKLSRRPFFALRDTARGTVKALPAPATVTHTAEPSSPYSKIRWEPCDPAELVGRMPPILSPKNFDWSKFSAPALQEAWDKADATHAARFYVQTAYGRWVFYMRDMAEGRRAVERVFKPAQKKWFRKHVGLIPLLPATTEVQKLLDDRLSFGQLISVQPHGTNELHESGLLCPWCGVWARRHAWESLKYRCFLCLVRSKAEVRG